MRLRARCCRSQVAPRCQRFASASRPDPAARPARFGHFNTRIAGVQLDPQPKALRDPVQYCFRDWRLDARLFRRGRGRRFSCRAARHRRWHDARAGAGGDVYRAAFRSCPHRAPRARNGHGVDCLYIELERARAPPPRRRRLVGRASPRPSHGRRHAAFDRALGLGAAARAGDRVRRDRACRRDADPAWPPAFRRSLPAWHAGARLDRRPHRRRLRDRLCRGRLHHRALHALLRGHDHDGDRHRGRVGGPVAVVGTLGYAISGSHVPDLPPPALGFVHGPALLGIVAGSVLTAPVGRVQPTGRPSRRCGASTQDCSTSSRQRCFGHTFRRGPLGALSPPPRQPASRTPSRKDREWLVHAESPWIGGGFALGKNHSRRIAAPAARTARGHRLAVLAQFLGRRCRRREETLFVKHPRNQRIVRLLVTAAAARSRRIGEWTQDRPSTARCAPAHRSAPCRPGSTPAGASSASRMPRAIHERPPCCSAA